MNSTETAFRLPGILRSAGVSSATPAAAGSTRFTQQSHALGNPIASPGALFIAATIAVALYLIGSRLSD